MLPARQEDIEDWPVTLRELEPHYEAVLKFVPMAAERDELESLLPLYTTSPGNLRRGLQTNMVLTHLRRHAAELSARHLHFGASRLAVSTSASEPSRCRHCGLCLYGCPYGSIYNSRHTLDELVRTGAVDYRGGVYVDRLTTEGDSVTIHLHERGVGGARGELTASRVFVACGVLSSTRLVLASLGHARTRRVLDSQYFVLPMLTARTAPVSVATQGNTLAQVFLELRDERLSRHTVHLQLYGFNDVLLSVLAARLPLRAERLERLLRPVIGRLVVLQGYLHSGDSPGLELEARGDGLRLRGDLRTDASRVARTVRRLARLGRALGMTPVPGLTQVGRPGKSNHLGGTFPMRRHARMLDTDTLGRLPGWDRIHLVDASVLPSVPATTATLTVMANAHRIASAVTTLPG